ncbi:Fam20C domain-containing protein [Aphelenchoides besseyi]|nr:Fam20C domain-containing protein [Aphelenchoides besseyi]
MQTLRFYTRRIVFLITGFFFGFLILIASRSPNGESNGLPEWLNQKRYARPMPIRAGEQLSFQPQPPPNLDAQYVPYHELNIPRFKDEEMIQRLNMHLRDLDLKSMARSVCDRNVTLEKFWSETQGRTVPKRDNWERFYANIGSCDLYRDEKLVDELLKDLATMPLKHVAIMDGGTQVKLIFTFENDKQAVFKPMRFGRDYETDPNHFYFGDFERHNAEIATFHIDKIFGFRRAVPTVGRIMNITSELQEKAEKKLKKTFFVSPAKNQCFVGKCDYYCDTTHAICGSPDLKEGSVQMFLPDDQSVPRRHNKSPYRRTYSKKTQLATWQTDMHYCQYKVKNRLPYGHGRRLLDLVDLHIMDYLIGNQDRHHYETFDVFTGMQSYAVHLDNGRSFGKTQFDDDDILMPLRQCCVIRPGTLERLMDFYSGKKSLSEVLHESLAKDPIAPVLAYKHYPALERRLHKIMQYVLECMDKTSEKAKGVVLNEYHNNMVEGEKPDDENDDTPQNDAVPAANPDAGAIPPPQINDNKHPEKAGAGVL